MELKVFATDTRGTGIHGSLHPKRRRCDDRDSAADWADCALPAAQATGARFPHWPPSAWLGDAAVAAAPPPGVFLVGPLSTDDLRRLA